ncbi:MAG: T9SS C-terminal target domain-containing protein [Bacteroidetes bacterium]|nr:MAG: T9SS C-terminal target domain-containing protein [Bacteroidota bacterium]
MKVLKLWLVPVCLLLTCGSLLQAQFLERQLISPLGHLSTTNTVHVSGTAGELIVSTVSTGSVTATQGFQQPNIEDLVGTYELSDLAIRISVFPNPVSSLLNVEFLTEESANVTIELYDVAGQLVFYSPMINVPERLTEVVDFARFPTGQYFLIVKDDKNRLLKTFKVQKHG